LVQVVSAGAAKTQTAFSRALQKSQKEETYFFWVSDEGVLNADALHHRWQVPLSRLLMVKARDAPEVWRIGLEAIQTGLFGFLFLRASSPCQSAQLRKLQLVAEKMRSEVFLLTPRPLPHWTLKETIEVHAHSVLQKQQTPSGFRGKLFRPDSESFVVQPL